MSHTPQPLRTHWFTAAGRGAEIGIALDFGYATAFLIYALLRSTTTLLATPDIDAGWFGTAFATWTALTLPAFVFAALFVPLVALLGALTGAAVYALLPVFNPERAPRRAAMIGIGVCSLVAFVLVLLIRLGAGVQWTPALAETLTFWFALPLLIYVVAGGAASWRLNQLLEDGCMIVRRDRRNPSCA